MVGKDVKIIEYPRRVDFWNFFTHAVPAFAAFFGLWLLLSQSRGARETVSSVIYMATLFTVYAASSFYHILNPGESKRRARLFDHCAVPLLIAGTATPCALVSLYEVSVPHGIFVLAGGWICVFFGIFSKLFFFEKLKNVTMAVYIILGAAMLLSAVPLLDFLDKEAFLKMVLGCIFYLTGTVFCAIGSKYPVWHIVFHIFVVFGSFTHYVVIYNYIICK